MPLQYDRLDANQSEIRLLTVLPGEVGDGIHCHVNTVSLSNSPDFVALSYTWGDSSNTTPITVNGEAFDVTINLEAALRRLRQPREAYVMWVDAICIDQANVNEKNTQVPLMGDIYKQATSVIAWLGESSSNIDLAVSWIETFVTSGPQSPFWIDLEAKPGESGKVRRDREVSTAKARIGYSEMLCNPYWGRMWTFQELRLAQQEPTCICGAWSLPLTAFLQAGDALQEAYRVVLDGFIKVLQTWLSSGVNITKLADETKQHIQSMQDLANMVKKTSDLERRYGLGTRFCWRKPDYRLDEPLRSILNTTAHRKCKDQRDKIYALYGLVPAIQKMYPPDYTKPVAQIMLETTEYLLSSELGGPKILTSFALRKERLKDNKFPSWMLDFATGMSDDEVPLKFLGYPPVAEALRDYRNILVDIKSGEMKLKARHLGQCSVALRFGCDEPEIVSQIVDILGLAGTEDRMLGILATGPDGTKWASCPPDSLKSRIARLCAIHDERNSEYSDEALLIAYREAFETICPQASPESKRPMEVSVFGSMIYMAANGLVGKVLTAASGRYLGICDGEVMDGDVVVLPPQMDQPVILRKEISSGPPPGEQNFRMIGTGFFGGISETESLDAELVAELEREPLKDYTVV